MWMKHGYEFRANGKADTKHNMYIVLAKKSSHWEIENTQSEYEQNNTLLDMCRNEALQAPNVVKLT